MTKSILSACAAVSIKLAQALPSLILEAGCVVGIGFVCHGVWQIYQPAGYIVIGLSILGIAAAAIYFSGQKSKGG